MVLPTDASIVWTVTARGFAPALGDEAVFRDDDDDRVARVALSPGWGAGLFFRAGDPEKLLADPGPWEGWTFPNASAVLGLLGGAPLPGIEVLSDGDVPCGKSDAKGALRIAVAAAPARLKLRCDGWRLVAVERTGFGLDDRFVVWMERDPH